MTEFVATYDLKKTTPDPYEKFKDIARDQRWFAAVIDSKTGGSVSLPNTTLSLTTDTMRSAVASFAGVVAKAKLDISNFHIERVTIIGGNEVRAFKDGETIAY